MHENQENKNRYQKYRESGGVIGEKDYENALARVRNAMAAHEMSPEKHAWDQVKLMAERAGIALDKDNADQRTMLYSIISELRAVPPSQETQKSYSQISDTELFAEALRMLEDADALNKLIEAYHKVGIYCPLCSKVVSPGQECR